MSSNKLIISAAGSGKTTFLIKQALNNPENNILITTYTEANETAIKDKFIKINKCIPNNVTVQTWFSFLLKHGAKPYQGSLKETVYENKIRGMYFAKEMSGIKYVSKAGFPVQYSEDEEFEKHYFTNDRKIYSDKISKFVIKCNFASNNAVVERISRIYKFIFIDEVQDLAGCDLGIIHLLLKSSTSIILVGDPRQVTYLTHSEKKYSKYRNGKIKEFIQSKECNDIECEIDETTLNKSHRNNQEICKYSSRLYNDFPTTSPCTCCRDDKVEHTGVFLIRKSEIEKYARRYNIVQLRWDSRENTILKSHITKNFGESKGQEFDRVIIYPTKDIIKWITDNNIELKEKTKAKFYVALTRARHSVAIVMDYDENKDYEGAIKYSPLTCINK